MTGPTYAEMLAAVLAALAVLAWPVARRPLRERVRTDSERPSIASRASPFAHAPPGSPTSRRRHGGRWRHLPAAGSRAGVPVPVVVELVAAALSAGLPTADALAATVRAAGPSAAPLSSVVNALRLGMTVERAWQRAGPAYASLGLALVLADRTGASAAAALRRTAADERAARRRRAQVAARALGVRLVVPLGLATLPSFALLAVVPVLLGLATQLLKA